MKQLMMLFSACAFAAITVKAQSQPTDDKTEKKKNKIEFLRIEGGVNISTITGNTPDYSSLAGAHFGAATRLLSFSRDAGLDLGVIYSMQGGKHKSTDYVVGGGYSNSSASTRLNYLNFPLELRYQKEHRGFFAEAGIQPGILLSAKNKNSNATENIKNDLKKFDVGIPLGLGYQKNKISGGLLATPGLMNINKNEEQKARNMVFALRASYTL